MTDKMRARIAELEAENGRLRRYVENIESDASKRVRDTAMRLAIEPNASMRAAMEVELKNHEMRRDDAKQALSGGGDE